MSAHTPVCRFTEGQLTLPEGYQDRTVNIFTRPGTDAPAFNLSRDTLHSGEDLAAYIDRQLALMAQHLKGWTQTARHAVALGDNLSQGELIHANYRRDGKRLWQQQAVFNPQDTQILVFTLSASRALSDADGTQFRSLLGSFRFHV